MKRNDKIIAVLGAVILILAALGIYYWTEEPMTEGAEVEDFYAISGEMKDTPEAIAVSDSCPFYALIATPVAIHYDSEGELSVIPLYIKNFEEPSDSIVRVEEQIGFTVDEMIKNTISPKNASLEFAKKYWESSKAALIIHYSQEGYNLGVLATPLASYFSIPVIVTDEMDNDVKDVLNDLGVERTIICGDIDGFGDVLKFNNADDIVNASIEIVKEKFDEVNYITIANPIDIHEPTVLGSTKYEFTGTLPGGNFLPSMLKGALKNFNTILGSGTTIGSFKIPDDYKYALVKFEGIAKYKGNEDPDLFGSKVGFGVTGEYELFASGLGTAAGSPERDSNGKIITDRIVSENVLYNLGGEEYTVSGVAVLFVSDSADVEATVVIQNLSDPLYPMMKKFSAIAPYLTAYRKGIIFGKPEFAFVADDNIRSDRNEKLPGGYQVRTNLKLQIPSNNHVLEIHGQLNKLLAKLAKIDLSEIDGLKELRDYYKENPVYIALVGGSVVIPQMIYDSYLTPNDPDAFFSRSYGLGIPTDIIYGNIDPIPGNWENTAPDIYWDENPNFPYQENIVGRITGWDVQDASALVARTVFYEDIIDDLGNWKNKATVATGCGTDFLQPPLITFINKLKGYSGPTKWYSGSTDLNGDALQKNVLEPLGFEVSRTKNTASQFKGFTDQAINTIKNTNLMSRLFFAPNLVRLISGENKVVGGKLMTECNIIWHNAHGMPNGYEMGDVMTDSLGWRPGINLLLNWFRRSNLLPTVTALTELGWHDVRNVGSMDLGPSVMVIESCFCGKIDGMYPVQAISQAPLHAGVNTLIAATTETNVPGGYLEPYLEKGLKWDRYNIVGYITNMINAKKGIYPENHFGNIIYTDFYNNLGKDQDVGTAFRNARNAYMPQDWESKFKWVPPLSSSENEEDYEAPVGSFPEHKYLAYYEYQVFGDPAFNPYVPNED